MNLEDCAEIVDTLTDTLTRCQAECTKLLLEKRALEDRVKKLEAYTTSAQDSAIKYGAKLAEMQDELFSLRRTLRTITPHTHGSLQ